MCLPPGRPRWTAVAAPCQDNVGLEQAHSLDSDEALETQSSDLISRLDARGAGGNVIVGHSQGGLVARRVGQHRPDLVSGVVTIGTPNSGAPIALAGSEVIEQEILQRTSTCFGNVLCDIVYFFARQGVFSGLLTWAVGDLIPAAGDDQPGSAFLQTLNSRSEGFRRYSIQVHVRPRWSWVRLLGDRESSRLLLVDGESLKGQDWVRVADRVYYAAWVLRALAAYIRWWVWDYSAGWGCYQSGYYDYWPPCYDPYYGDWWWQASYWSRIADALDWIGRSVIWAMDGIDRFWYRITVQNGWQPVAPGPFGTFEGTDGFIPWSSQRYPLVPGAFAPGRFGIPISQESHTGETASPEVLRWLRRALDDANFPRR